MWVEKKSGGSVGSSESELAWRWLGWVTGVVDGKGLRQQVELGLEAEKMGRGMGLMMELMTMIVD